MQKLIGSILVGAGTAIGGSTLAMPIILAGMGFPLACAFLIGIWALTWVAGLLTLEANLAFKAPNNSFATMAETTLGKTGKWATAIIFLLLLYSLISAYISGGASLIQAACLLLFDYTLPTWVNTVIFAAVLGGIVAFSTRAVDLFNRGLFSIKTVLILIIFIVFIPQIDVSQLILHNDLRYVAIGLPVILVSFGAHITIPSIAPYMHNDVKKLKAIVLYGGLLPLVVYLLWMACMLGTIPYYGENSLASIAASPTQLEALMLAVNASVRSPIMSVVINTFSHIAIITSFLGVGLSLFDFLRDRKTGVAPHRFQSALLTLVPPLLVGLFYHDALVQLLSFAAIFAALILMIIPALMVWRLRQMPTLKSIYRTPGGTPMLIFVIVAALGLILAEILRLLNLLPIWTG